MTPNSPHVTFSKKTGKNFGRGQVKGSSDQVWLQTVHASWSSSILKFCWKKKKKKKKN